MHALDVSEKKKKNKEEKQKAPSSRSEGKIKNIPLQSQVKRFYPLARSV